MRSLVAARCSGARFGRKLRLFAPTGGCIDRSGRYMLLPLNRRAFGSAGSVFFWAFSPHPYTGGDDRLGAPYRHRRCDRRRRTGHSRVPRRSWVYEHPYVCVLAVDGWLTRALRGGRSDAASPVGRRSRRVLLLDRHSVEPGARSHRRGRGGGVRGQVVRVPPRGRHPARGAGGERRARSRAHRNRREPELLHDSAHDGARAAARCRRPEERPRRDLPVGVRRGLRCDCRSSRRGGGRPSAAHGLGVRRRRVRRRGQAPRGDAQDPRASRTWR